MHGSLFKPLIDQATRTFVNRCAELSLAVWSYDGKKLKLNQPDDKVIAELIGEHARELGQGITQKIDELTQSQSPITLPAGTPAAWIGDAQGPVDGFVVVPIPTQHGPPQTVEQLAPAAKALSWNLHDLRSSDMNMFAVEDLAEQLGKSYESITLLYGKRRNPDDMTTRFGQRYLDYKTAVRRWI